jgi:thiamine phosphate synthase YjbQ (UPF0047 family)
MRSETIEVRTGGREVVRDLTRECADFLVQVAAADGLLHDLLAALRDLLPADDRWEHAHGSPGHGRTHVLPALVAPYLTLPVLAGRMQLGTWQSVCLVDLNVDNPERTVRLSFLAG